MDNGLPWYRRRPRAFLDGVQGMGPELIGAYAVLLDLFYARGGRSLRDDRHLSGVLGCSTRKAKSLTDALLERGKVIVRGEFITNSVVEKEANHSRITRESLANRGRMGAEKRWRGKENKDLEIATPSTPKMLDKIRVDKRERATDVAIKKTPTFVLSHLLGNELAASVVEHRQRLGKPMTTRAAELMMRQFEKCTEPIAGAEMMIERGWVGFKADWFRNDGNRKRTNGDDRHSRKIEMATRQDRRGEADSGVDHDASGSDPVALLPAEHFGRS